MTDQANLVQMLSVSVDNQASPVSQSVESPGLPQLVYTEGSNKPTMARKETNNTVISMTNDDKKSGNEDFSVTVSNNNNNNNNNNNDNNENNNESKDNVDEEEKSDKIELNTEDEDMVIRLSQIIPNYKQWLKDNPRQVYCASEMTLLSVDLVTQTFDVEIEIHLFWQQPQIRRFMKEDQTWSMFDDQYSIPVDLDDPFDGDLALEWIEKEYHYHEETGVVELLLHLKDKFAERMELERFPVDRQFLNINLMGRTAEDEGNWVWIRSKGDSHPEWVPEDYRGDNQLQARLGPAVADYQMFQPWADFNILQIPKPGYTHCLDEQPPFKLRFRVQRYPGFYVGSIIVPMVLIISCCFASLAIDPADIADRLSVSITLMLATVAFKFVTSTILPPVSYLTWMDKYMLIMFVVISAFVLDNAIATFFGGRLFDAVFAMAVGIVLSGSTGFMLFALYTDYLRLDWITMDEEDRNSDEDDFMPAQSGMILGPVDIEENLDIQDRAQQLWDHWKESGAKPIKRDGKKGCSCCKCMCAVICVLVVAWAAMFVLENIFGMNFGPEFWSF